MRRWTRSEKTERKRDRLREIGEKDNQPSGVSTGVVLCGLDGGVGSFGMAMESGGGGTGCITRRWICRLSTMRRGWVVTYLKSLKCRKKL